MYTEVLVLPPYLFNYPFIVVLQHVAAIFQTFKFRYRSPVLWLIQIALPLEFQIPVDVIYKFVNAIMHFDDVNCPKYKYLKIKEFTHYTSIITIYHYKIERHYSPRLPKFTLAGKYA